MQHWAVEPRLLDPEFCPLFLTLLLPNNVIHAMELWGQHYSSLKTFNISERKKGSIFKKQRHLLGMTAEQKSILRRSDVGWRQERKQLKSVKGFHMLEESEFVGGRLKAVLTTFSLISDHGKVKATAQFAKTLKQKQTTTLWMVCIAHRSQEFLNTSIPRKH